MSQRPVRGGIPGGAGARRLGSWLVSESVWPWSADELLQRVSSDAPTPGSGTAAAAAGALGVALLRKAIVITGGSAASLDPRAASILDAARAAADADVAAFGALMDARGMPEGDEVERAERDDAVALALREATEGPLALVATLVEALRLAEEAHPLVKHELESDVLAGADLVRGAARAALRAVDLDLEALERSGAQDAERLRARRDELVAELDALMGA